MNSVFSSARSIVTRRRLMAGALTALLLLTACSASTDDVNVAPPATDDESIYGSFPIDPPAGDEVVLTIEGATTVTYTMDELKGRATTDVTLFEPFVRRDETFAVIRLSQLLTEAGITDDDYVETVALNDYRYSQRAGDLTANEALLAVMRDGEPIPMDAGGPIRLVFANDSGYAEELDAWNWSLHIIKVTAAP